MPTNVPEPVLDSRARRAARRVNLEARKSRWRLGTPDNHGGFQLIDPFGNYLVAGERYDMTAEDVIEWCRQ